MARNGADQLSSSHPPVVSGSHTRLWFPVPLHRTSRARERCVPEVAPKPSFGGLGFLPWDVGPRDPQLPPARPPGHDATHKLACASQRAARSARNAMRPLSNPLPKLAITSTGARQSLTSSQPLCSTCSTPRRSIFLRPRAAAGANVLAFFAQRGVVKIASGLAV